MQEKTKVTVYAVLAAILIIVLTGIGISHKAKAADESVREFAQAVNAAQVSVSGKNVAQVPTSNNQINPAALTPIDRAQKPATSADEAAQIAANRKELAARIKSYLRNDPAWQQAKVGIYIGTLNGEEVYSNNGNLPMIPASNLKVVTTSAALSLLSPEFRFETSVWFPEINRAAGAINGNLYLKGTGDPTFMEPFTNNPTEVFHGFAKALKKEGVKVIEGDLVGDDSAFDREFLGRGWKSRYLNCDYAAPAGALSINGNLVTLIVSGGTVSMLPGNKYIQIVNNPGGSFSVNRKYGTDCVTVRGTSGGKTYESMTINNPSKYSTAVFAEVLRANGIKINGKVRLISSSDADYQNKNKKFAMHRSESLAEIVHQINKESDNVCAQHVFKAIGCQTKGQGTVENCNQAIKEWMTYAGIDSSGFVMADGSGLSTYNRITPHQLCSVLAYMKRTPVWKHFWTSLPVAGKDGTLDCRLHGLPIRAKTGGLQGHIALSGYVQTKTGQMLVFSMLTNGHHHWGDRIRQNEDTILEIVAGYNKRL